MYAHEYPVVFADTVQSALHLVVLFVAAVVVFVHTRVSFVLGARDVSARLPYGQSRFFSGCCFVDRPLNSSPPYIKIYISMSPAATLSVHPRAGHLNSREGCDVLPRRSPSTRTATKTPESLPAACASSSGTCYSAPPGPIKTGFLVSTQAHNNVMHLSKLPSLGAPY